MPGLGHDAAVHRLILNSATNTQTQHLEGEATTMEIKSRLPTHDLQIGRGRGPWRTAWRAALTHHRFARLSLCPCTTGTQPGEELLDTHTHALV